MRRHLKMLTFFVLAVFFGVKQSHAFRRQVSQKVDSHASQRSQLHTSDKAPESAGKKLSPIIWVPGITSMALEARRIKGTEIGNPWCAATVPEDDWYMLYVSSKQSANLPCFVWSMTLQPPDDQGCVKDAEGLEIREVGFGSSAGVAHLNPGDPIPFPLYEKLISSLEKVNHVRDKTIKFATYDWRKYGDRCWEEHWFPRFKKLIEDTVKEEGRRATIGCHSMGCPLVHNFLSSDYVDDSWKQRFVEKFVATAPAFAGATQILQNFIQGPSYAMMPLAASQFGRDAMTSMPGFFTLLPTRIGGAWDEDLVIVDTPWKKYTISSIYDGSFFADVEEPEIEVGKAQQNDVAELQARPELTSEADSVDTVEVVTRKGCVCSGPCSSSLPNLQDYVDVLPRALRSNIQPWCYTVGNCGSSLLLVGQRWDYCDSDAEPMDGGPGFEFFPGVNTKPSFLLKRLWATSWLFGEAESYKQIHGASVEEIKHQCLADWRCMGFDTDGWLKKGISTPSKTWRGVRRISGKVFQGLYVKRQEVKTCQVECADHGITVCGSDGRTYASKCLLANAKCWMPALEISYEGSCKDSFVTSQGCRCNSHGCGVAVGMLPSYVPLTFGLASMPYNNQRWCFTDGSAANPTSPCGNEVMGMKWDYCGDEGGANTGRGFEYFPATYIEGSELRQVPAPFSVDTLQEECGQSPQCGGFTTGGMLLSHSFRDVPNSWYVHSNSTQGIYRKQRSIAECQKVCGGEEAKPVCLQATKTTYRSECDLKNALCWYSHFSSTMNMNLDYRVGACRRQGRTALHEFAKEFVARAAEFQAPGVPTVCMYIEDRPTELSWKYAPDFVQKGEVVEKSKGDGTVNVQSALAPCNAWKREQKQDVRLVKMDLNGPSHVTMLFSSQFLDMLTEAVMDESFHEGFNHTVTTTTTTTI